MIEGKKDPKVANWYFYVYWHMLDPSRKGKG